MSDGMAAVVCTGRGTHDRAEIDVPADGFTGTHVELSCPVCPRRTRLGQTRFAQLVNAVVAPGRAGDIDLSWL